MHPVFQPTLSRHHRLECLHGPASKEIRNRLTSQQGNEHFLQQLIFVIAYHDNYCSLQIEPTLPFQQYKYGKSFKEKQWN